ncbi:putative sensory transduction regulator [Fodinibius salinus]|uniref:Putative sensory transduction regulator n=1 Tax=Fodinibius salinus TaxID=860790 RepID=A0A5D3YM78_9BACT|nr:YbjN domain-containing protein [Fodinibius salinus]TYP94862.1 putative sensory transduction regulator [Fodinibius salinus]
MENLIDEYLQEAGIPASKQYDEDGDVLYFTEFELESGTFRLTIIISSEYQNVTLLLNAPIKVPPPKRGEIAEYIARANFHCYEGNIMLDFSDGTLAYKSSLRYDPAEDNSHIRYQLNVSLGMAFDEMETHFPGILSVIYNDELPDYAHGNAVLGTRPELN